AKEQEEVEEALREQGWSFATPQGNTGASPHHSPPGQLSGLRCRQVRSGDGSLVYLAAPGAACTLLWRRAPGLVVRRQSPKALQILEGKRLEPQALQGNLPDNRSAKEGQVVSGLRMAEKQGREPECPVCWNPFNNTFHTPKVLDCCHSFCVECLAHLSLVTPARRRLLCPLCRQPTVLASGQPVTDLPTDTAVLTLLRLEPHHDVAPTTIPIPIPSPSHDSLRGCFRNPQFRIFAYLLAVILSVTLLLIFSIFWTKQFFGGVG
ncbi:hypothetical protein E2I00_012831, partial [Balaenoptera physalus]